MTSHKLLLVNKSETNNIKYINVINTNLLITIYLLINLSNTNLISDFTGIFQYFHMNNIKSILVDSHRKCT